MEKHLVDDTAPETARYLPCDICGEPAKVTSRFTEWAAHWSCALLGKKRIEELKRAGSAGAPTDG